MSNETLSHAPSKAVVHEEKTKEFKLPEANSNMHRVFAYLIKQRFISPDIISHFAKQHTLYEDKQHHNAVFVGLDENGVPRQASKRSTNSFGKTFRITCEGSDTRYSFSHFGKSEKLFVLFYGIVVADITLRWYTKIIIFKKIPFTFHNALFIGISG